VEITTAMLADAATIADGKLYIQGGGWNSIITSQIPAVHPAIGLVLIFKLDWHEANEDLEISIELVSEDGKLAGLRGEMQLRVAPAPATKKGTELYQSTAQMFYGLRFDDYGAYRFQIAHKDQIMASVPLNVVAPQGVAVL
jgi:hypothetical protein